MTFKVGNSGRKYSNVQILYLARAAEWCLLSVSHDTHMIFTWCMCGHMLLNDVIESQLLIFAKEFGSVNVVCLQRAIKQSTISVVWDLFNKDVAYFTFNVFIVDKGQLQLNTWIFESISLDCFSAICKLKFSCVVL